MGHNLSASIARFCPSINKNHSIRVDRYSTCIWKCNFFRKNTLAFLLFLVQSQMQMACFFLYWNVEKYWIYPQNKRMNIINRGREEPLGHLAQAVNRLTVHLSYFLTGPHWLMAPRGPCLTGFQFVHSVMKARQADFLFEALGLCRCSHNSALHLFVAQSALGKAKCN